MDYVSLKSMVGEIAKDHGFRSAGGGWFMINDFVLIALNLQKSNYGRYADINLKIFLDMDVPRSGVELKPLITRLSGDIFRRQPRECNEALDLDSALDASARRTAIERFFAEIVDRVAVESSSASGLFSLRDEGVLYLLPAVEDRLKRA